MIGSVDIFQLSPGFRTAVFNVHNVLMGVALVVVFGGLVQKITDAQRGRNVGEIMPALQRPRRWVLVVYLRFALGDFRLIRWAVVDFKIVRARRERRC